MHDTTFCSIAVAPLVKRGAIEPHTVRYCIPMPAALRCVRWIRRNAICRTPYILHVIKAIHLDNVLVHLCFNPNRAARVPTVLFVPCD